MSSHDAICLQGVDESVSEDGLCPIGSRLKRCSPDMGVPNARMRMVPFIPLTFVGSSIQQTLVGPNCVPVCEVLKSQK